jgi:diguanylate cyclase (GGDEF)-like protein
MRLVGRHDTSLGAGLIAGAVLLFHQPLQLILDAAGDFQQRYHVDLVQSLLVLCAVLAFHQYRKGQEAKADLNVVAAKAEQERVRSEGLERLVGLSRALAAVSDFTHLNQVISRYLPRFTGDRAAWLLICQQGCWDVLVRDADDRSSADHLQAIAERAFCAQSIRAGEATYVRIDGLVCVPMMVGAHPAGIILVQDRPTLSEEDCRTLEAAAALAAIAVRNVRTLIETREHSLRDGLTGCFNRAHAVDTLKGELRRAERAKAPLSMIMFDVDGFKGVNDGHGHLAGDQILAEVGARLSEVLRTSDVKCRYGGDEFLIILPETPALGARQVAESIRQEMARIVLKAGEAEVRVTVSVGIATTEQEEASVQAFIARADRELYRAKRGGRNRVCGGEKEAAAAPLRLVSAAV